jgi:Ni2+-binding GTPase involved in maturation of urease and hydrogenase
MKIITVCGPASSGKTSVIRKAIISLGLPPSKIGVIKYDCLSALERSQYAGLGINIRVELAGDICPDHYFVSRLETNVRWGIDKNLSW